MTWTSTYLKDLVIGVCIFFVPFFVPFYNVSTDVGTLVTATSTIFAVVAGFFIADAMSNYLRLQTLISEENAALISLSDNATKIDSLHAPIVHEAIDAYMIAQLDAGTLNHILDTDTQVDQIDEAVKKLEVGPEDTAAYDHLLSMKEKILTSRQEILFAAKKNLTPGHWATLVTLGVLVALTVLAIRDGNIFMNVIAGAMIVGTQAILVLLRDMDNNRLLEMKLGYDNPREVFHALLRPPYYPFSSPLYVRAPDRNGLYRVGKKARTAIPAFDVIDTKKGVSAT